MTSILAALFLPIRRHSDRDPCIRLRHVRDKPGDRTIYPVGLARGAEGIPTKYREEIPQGISWMYRILMLCTNWKHT